MKSAPLVLSMLVLAGIRILELGEDEICPFKMSIEKLRFRENGAVKIAATKVCRL
jgi:hypothetical protein